MSINFNSPHVYVTVNMRISDFVKFPVILCNYCHLLTVIIWN